MIEGARGYHRQGLAAAGEHLCRGVDRTVASGDHDHVGRHLHGALETLADPGRRPAQQVDLEAGRSEEHTSELQSLMRISYAVFCLKKKTNKQVTRPTDR